MLQGGEAARWAGLPKPEATHQGPQAQGPLRAAHSCLPGGWSGSACPSATHSGPEADGSRAEEAMAAEGQDGRTCLCLASRSALPPHPPHPAPVRLCNNWKNRGLFVPLSLIKMRNNKLSIFFLAISLCFSTRPIYNLYKSKV